MSAHAWITVAVLAGMLALLVRGRIPPYLVLLGGLAVLLTMGVVSPRDALKGFSNEGMLTVALLYVVVAGLRRTGGLAGLVDVVFGKAKSVFTAQLRMMLPVMTTSAFINNTPVVAAFIPMITDWARKFRISPSKLMMPLSYAAILGGSCTLIGTSTNLVVNGLLIDDPAQRSLGFFELAWVGVPVALAGIAYILLTSRWLLPDRVPPVGEMSDPRQYTVEMIVTDDSPLAGKSIEQAGLRHLPGLFVIEIQRDDRVLPAVSPDEVLYSGDRLVFAGITESVADLQAIRGLAPATEQVFKLDSPRADRRLVEAIVAPSARTVGRTVRESGFRNQYDAVVIAVGRDGERVLGKVGDIVLQPGDMLLLESEPGFVRKHENDRDFLLLRPLDGVRVPRHERSWIAWTVIAGMVVAATAGWLSMFNAALLAAGMMLVTRCIRPRDALRSIDLEVLLTICAAFGIGAALAASGAAASLAGGLLSAAGDHPLALLAAVYVVTSILTGLITNNAAAVLMFPLAVSAAHSAGLEVMPFAVAIMLAASASFATPISYQTNLMVYGPGGYRFNDYLRFGVPLNLIAAVVTITVVPMVWSF